MKKSTHLIHLLIGAFCAPLAAATLLQSPGSTPPMDKCPDMGVQMVDAAFTPTQMAACEFGFLHYEGFGLDLTWEDPVCPLSVIWEPAYSSVVAKPNMTVKHVDNSHARMFEFVCDKDEEVCRHSASHELPGFYPFYIELPCGY
ncbi:hypothetical protein N9C81_01165 [Planctomycetota bacterium]|jgi:hypothetical protein|nr:hypothetical protein [Planctomycetota bacterium]